MISILSNPWGLGLVYGSTFFIAALTASLWRWSCRPGLAAFVAYALFLLFYLSSVEWKNDHLVDRLVLLTPLFTAPLGGVVGGRLFPKT